jgi:uncharacterized protein
MMQFIFSKRNKTKLYFILCCIICFYFITESNGQSHSPAFKVIAFYTAKHDQAHISFVHEANKWFSKIAVENNFTYDSTRDWNNLNSTFLLQYKVVIFLDTRPDSLPQRKAFQKYMEHGGRMDGISFFSFCINTFRLSSKLGLVS